MQGKFRQRTDFRDALGRWGCVSNLAQNLPKTGNTGRSFPLSLSLKGAG